MRLTRSSGAGRDAWPSYAVLAVVGYAIYGVGAVAPYLRAQLGLSNAQVALHPTAMAIGLLVSGTIVAGLGRRFGEVAVRGAAIVGLALAVVALALAPAIGVTLAAAMLVGLGIGTLLGYANAVLARPGGRQARLRVARANVWAMAAAFACPIVLAVVASTDLPWGLGLAPALVLLLAVGIDLRAGPRLDVVPETGAQGRLPTGYWLAWGFLVAAVALEFSIVFWGSTLVAARTGADMAVATLLGGLFLGGMFLGRLAQSFGLGTGGDFRRPAAAGVGLAAVGASIAWASPIPAVSGGAFFVAGLGVAGLYPLGVAAALAAAPGRLTLAGTRVTLASGAAIIAAPFALGVVADATGVLVGWGIVIGIAAVALALAAVLPTGAALDAGSGPADVGPSSLAATGRDPGPPPHA